MHTRACLIMLCVKACQGLSSQLCQQDMHLAPSAFVPLVPVPVRPSQPHRLSQQEVLSRRRQTSIFAAKNNKAQQVVERKGILSNLFGKQKAEEQRSTRKRVKQKVTRPAANAKKAAQQKAAAEAQQQRQRFQRSVLQRDNWDTIEKEKIPLRNVGVGAGTAVVVSGYFLRRWWSKRRDKLMVDFVDDMMAAGLDTDELYRIALKYKTKLGPFASRETLNDYLKAVYRAPDLSSRFIVAMDMVVNQLFKVKENELLEIIDDIAREMAKGQEWVGMTILLFTFERILPEDAAGPKLDSLRRALSKALPGKDIEKTMFELAKEAYSMEIEALFTRGQSPLVTPEGWDVLGLSEEQADEVYHRFKRAYEGEQLVAQIAGVPGENLGDTLIVKRRDPLHEMIFGRSDDIVDKYVTGYKEKQDKKQEEKKRGRPPTWEETVGRISRIVLSKEGEDVLSTLPKFQCLRCSRVDTLLPGQLEDDVFHMDWRCPQCNAGREMLVRKE